MIVGVGIDILAIHRIEHLLMRFPERFKSKTFTESEIAFCEARSNMAASFAKVFSLKEATIKAISDVGGVKWHDMEISHDSNGKPLITLHGNALRNVLRKAPAFSVLASVSDEKDYVSAFVIIEGH
ncbi:MAG: holo-ACP synthase [Holosporales bacterium]|nr:holo-ACP synthase [Holosporales bacterium]